MAKAKELPSGNWRVQVSTGKKNEKGKYIYESITRPTKKEAEYAALEYELKLKRKKAPGKMTLREAFDKYINNKDSILSPSTINGYKRLSKNRLQDIMDLPLDSLTQELIQQSINTDSQSHAPKSVRNAHGLLSAVLRDFHPDFVLRTRLPQRQKYIASIPESEDVVKIIKGSMGTDIEIPILLALWLGLRQSEICGLKWDSIDFKKNTITVKRALVESYEDGRVLKKTKSYSGTRVLNCPQYIMKLLKDLYDGEHGEFVIQIRSHTIYKKFKQLLEEINVEHCRFHDLRHANASIMLALNVPDKYAMKRLGHATPNMLKQVYQHTMQKEENEVNELVNQYFDNLIKD